MDGTMPIIIIAIGILVFVHLFIFAKRQIFRFAQKFSTPHAPIGHDAPKKLVAEIERRLNIVKDIRFEPKLMNPMNEHANDENLSKYKHIYRMKAIDSLKSLEDEVVQAHGNESIRRHPGNDLRVYLLDLRKENMPLRGCESKLINEFVEYYWDARSSPNEFGFDQYEEYMSRLNRIKSTIIPRIQPSKTNSPIYVNKSRKSKTYSTQVLAHDGDTKILNTKESETCV